MLIMHCQYPHACPMYCKSRMLAPCNADPTMSLRIDTPIFFPLFLKCPMISPKYLTFNPYLPEAGHVVPPKCLWVGVPLPKLHKGGTPVAAGGVVQAMHGEQGWYIMLIAVAHVPVGRLWGVCMGVCMGC